MTVLSQKYVVLAIALFLAPAAWAQTKDGTEFKSKPKTLGLGLVKPGTEENRLGISASSPDAVLIKQLSLPKDQGVCVLRVRKDSSAEKAGLQQYDVLLQLNGKPIPSDSAKFAKLVADLKADMPVDIVVVREGKQQTIKGLVIPASKEAK